MRIALVQAHHPYGLFTHVHPLGLMMIASSARSAGFDDLHLIDMKVERLGTGDALERLEELQPDWVGISATDNYEFLARPFTPAPGVSFPVGGYKFRDAEVTYTLGMQHRFSGTFTVRAGEYFSGTIRSVGFRQGRVGLTERFSLEPSLSVNWIDTPQGAFRTDLAVSRVSYSFTPRMFLSGLIQYNSSTDTISNNLRLRWEYSPGSELFVVYTEDRLTDPLRPDRFSELRNRGFVVKMNRLFRF